MNLGIITEATAEGIKWVREQGLGYAEFCYNVGNSPKELDERLDSIIAACEQYGVKVGSVGRWGPDKFDKDGKVIEEEFNNQLLMIDITSRLGCPVFNTGANFVEGLSLLENCDIAADYLAKLIEYGRDKGVKIATYNCDWNNYIRTPEVWTLIHGKLPELGIKYDVSHCINVHHGDYKQEIADWGKRFYHFHIKGTINIGGRHIDDPPAGLDMVDWHTVMGLLYQAGYDAMLSIEPHSGVWKGKLGDWGIKYTINYIGKMIYSE